MAVVGIPTFYLFSKINSDSIKNANITTTQPVASAPQPMQNIPTPQSSPSAIDSSKIINYLVTLKTSKGDVGIEMISNQAPLAVQNFVSLSKLGFYNGTIFHRVISGFMIQGGDPKGDGTGGPGYTFNDERFVGEYIRGTVAMANAGPNTNGSQFFIMHQDVASLPKNYTIFGHVVSGMDIVDAIAADPVGPGPSGENSSPVNPTTVDSVVVSEK